MPGQAVAAALPSQGPRPQADDGWGRRKRVLGLLDEFDRQVLAARTQTEVSSLVRGMIEWLDREQASPGDRAYLQRSVTRVATAVRRAGWPALAAEMLERAVNAGLADEYIFAEAILNRLTLSQWAAADRLMDEARTCGLTSRTVYGSMLSAYARQGWADKCREIFEHADRDGFVTDECCAALIKAYGKHGSVEPAQSVFDHAVRQGVAGTECYVALVNTYAHASRSTDARDAFDAARVQGISDPRLFTGLVLGYCKCGFIGEAERACSTALEDGQLSDLTVAVIVEWYAQRGHFRRAEKLLHRAEAAAVPGNAGHTALASAYQRKGHFSAARRIRRRTRDRGLASSAPRVVVGERFRHLRQATRLDTRSEEHDHALADAR
jgi:pentatricopeptide repeat protein